MSDEMDVVILEHKLATLANMLYDIRKCWVPNKNLEKKIVALDEKSVKAQRDVQEQILKQSNELMDEIRTKHEEISSSLNDAVKMLTDKKTDRVALANLLTEVSMRLKEEFSLPEF